MICQYCDHKLTDGKCLNPACPGKLIVHKFSLPDGKLVEIADERIWIYGSFDYLTTDEIDVIHAEIHRNDPDIAEAREKEDREMYEHPNPLAEWKALKPGRKVLNKISKRVWSIVSFSERGNCYQLVDPENKEVGTSLGSSQEDFENNYQILHEGPFDAGKLQPGDWLWDEHYRQWVQFKEIASDGLIGIISHGINYYVNPYNPNLYFAPPSREERIEKALSNTTPYLSQDVIVPVEKLEAGRYRMMIPVEISTTGGLLLDRRDGLHGYSLEDYPNAIFFKGW